MEADFDAIDDTSLPFFLLPISPDTIQEVTVEPETPGSETRFDLPFVDASAPAEESFLASLTSLYDLHHGDCINSTSESSRASSDEYTITSLDEVSSSTSPFSNLEEPTSTTVLEEDGSITSRLKSVLMSRQKQKYVGSNRLSANANSSINAIHSYVQPHETRVCTHDTIDERILGSNTLVEDRPKGSTLRFPPCFVCGGTASGLHYGVNSCEPCKGFFTRYLRKQEEYQCLKDNRCKITNRLRGNCSACRLKKCLDVGMSRKNSRLGRYSLARRMETIMQVNKLEGKVSNSHQLGTCVQHTNSSTDVTATENRKTVSHGKCKNVNGPSTCKVKAANGFSQKLVKCLVSHMDDIKPYGEDIVTSEQINDKLTTHYESFHLKRELFGNMKTVPKEEYYALRKEFGIEIDHRMMYLKDSAQEVVDVISRYCTFAKQIPKFKTLSNRDQSNLLKSSRYDFFMILMHEGYHHEHQVFLAHSGVAFHREEVADKFFSRLLVHNVCDMYHRLQMLQLSKEEKALLIAIALLFTDRCVLENPSLVEQTQISLTQLLRNQLEKTCRSSASKRFTKIVDCLTVMRESSELYLREYNQLCKDERVIEEVPIMTAMLFEDI